MKIEMFKDDLDGTCDDTVRRITFALDGVDYEIDLSENNANDMYEKLAVYASAARPVRRGGAKKVASPARKPKSETSPAVGDQPPYETKKARAWLKENGHEVADKGRLQPEQAQLYLDSEQYKQDAAS